MNRVRRAVAAMALLMLGAMVLSWAAPQPGTLVAAFRHPQGWVGAHGVDAAIMTVAVAVSWLLLGWLALGVVVSLAGQLPGLAGWMARSLAAAVLPRAIRQAVTVALGVGLVTAGASAAAADTGSAGPGAAASAPGATVDWPVQPAPPPVPPPVYGGPPGIGDPVDGAIVVARGDSLWALASDRLPGAAVAQIADAVTAWYQANRDVIGPDPDLIYPGQLLVPPPPR